MVNVADGRVAISQRSLDNDRNRKPVTIRFGCNDLRYRRPAQSSNPVKGENVLLGRLDAAAEDVSFLCDSTLDTTGPEANSP